MTATVQDGPVQNGGHHRRACALQRRRVAQDPAARGRRARRFLVLDLVGNIVRARHDAESTASLLAATRAMGMAPAIPACSATPRAGPRPAPLS